MEDNSQFLASYDDYASRLGDLASNAQDFNNFGAQLAGLDAKYSSLESLLSTQMQNNYNSAEAVKQRNYEEYMSNTQYQRAVKDLEAAGFSPLALLSSANSAGSSAGTAASSSASVSGKGSNSGNLMKGILGALLSVVLGSATIASKASNATASKGISKASVSAYKKQISSKGLSNALKQAEDYDRGVKAGMRLGFHSHKNSRF